MKLKELILDNLQVPISQFCKTTQISRATIYNILQDKHTPSISTINKICKYFNVKPKDYVD